MSCRLVLLNSGCKCLPEPDGQDLSGDSPKNADWAECPCATRVELRAEPGFSRFVRKAACHWSKNTKDKMQKDQTRRSMEEKAEVTDKNMRAEKLREPPNHLTVDALRYMRLATAAYGRVTLRPGLVGITEDNFKPLLCKHVGDSLNPEEARRVNESTCKLSAFCGLIG